ncbi:MAG: DNA repair protein RecO [Bdellovibrionia bacterium]
MTEKLIVLRVFPHSESDLVIHGINTHGAKVVFYARGALRSRKRFGGGILEPTHYIQVLYRVSHKNPDAMMQMQEATLIEDFPKLREDYERLELALHCLTLTDRMSKEGTVHSEGVFHLLGNMLRTIETSDNLPLLKLHFELKLIALQGDLPFIEGAEDLLKASVKEHQTVNLSEHAFGYINSSVERLLGQY